MSKNDEFMTDEDLSKELNGAPAKPQTIPGKETAAKKTKKFIDPERDRKNWPVIELDHEDGKPNFHFISVSGTMKDGTPFTHDLKLQRGVDVPVPPSVVNMLQTTKKAVFHQTHDPVANRNVMHRTERPPIPWRLVEKGKYIR